MFDFQKEVIINSADKFHVVTERMINPQATTNNPVYLHVDRCADYYPEYIVGGNVDYEAGCPGTENNSAWNVG